MDRTPIRVLVACALLLGLLQSASPVSASGQYLHIFMADRSVDEVENAELRGILRDNLALYKFASLFPDSWGYDVLNDSDKANAVAALTHGPEFLNAYARAINQECFTTPIGEYTCQTRGDISCSGPLDATSCVVGGGYCSHTGNACNLGSPTSCNPLAGNICLARGVCTSNYRESCGIGNIPTDCPGAGNLCTPTYGVCRENIITPYCERLVTHFMGSIAHIVADINFDKFFVTTVSEMDTCIEGMREFYNEEDFPELPNDPSNIDLAQLHTDQDLDAHLASHANVEGGRDLASYLPGLLSGARVDVQDTFVRDDVLEPLTSEAGNLSHVLNLQWLAIGNKINGAGDLFNGVAWNGESWVPIDYRTPNPDACGWTSEDDHWRTEAGGASDTAEEIAKMAEEAWRYMRDYRRRPVFERSGKWPDVHLCVGSNTGPSCLEEKSADILDAP